MTVCFVELAAFTSEVLRVADDETLRQFELQLAAHPEAGEIIQHSGGLRKARMKLLGRGKSGGARVMMRAFHAQHQGQAGRHSESNSQPPALGRRIHQDPIQPMKTKGKKAAEIHFDAEELLSRVEAFAAGNAPVRERTIKLPPPVKAMHPREIRAIREQLGFTQMEFAALLNVPKVTAISWENGTRKPSGAALRLLAVAREHPEALQAA